MSCKCVCKSWLHLLETPEFVKSHFSKSIPGLAVFRGNARSKPYKVYEFANELDPEPNCNFAFSFSLHPHRVLIQSSVDGLLLLFSDGLIICNPVTQDYIKLPSHLMRVPSFGRSLYQRDTFGFGVSKISGQYKVVRVFQNNFDDFIPHQLMCQVYTLGTGSWRSIAPSGPTEFILDGRNSVAFLNGIFHFLVKDQKGRPWISCFDFETEVLSRLSLPSCHDYPFSRMSLCALRDCLCFCETAFVEIVIWSMNSYGDEKSWRKLYTIKDSPPPGYSDPLPHHPIKVFEDGDLLIEKSGDHKLIWYSSKTETMRDSGLIKPYGHNSRTSAVSYTPSFLSLKTFPMEKVSSFGREGKDKGRSMKRKKSE